MANSPDPNNEPPMDFEDMEGNLDPFADSPAPEGGEGGGDPFNFGPGTGAASPPPEGAAPPPQPRKAPAKSKPTVSAKKASPAQSAPKSESRAVGLAADVPVQVVAVLGKKVITVQDLISFKKGQVVELNRFPNEAVDLVANGKLMAKGELVEIDGKLGVRIIKIFE